jgi:hypothetical protein
MTQVVFQGWVERDGRVSKWDTGVEMMPEWKFGAERKACICNGIWLKWIGKRPATKGGVRTLKALRSDE